MKILITGASRGIGRETALLLAEQKHDLILTYCTDKNLGEKTAEDCRALGATCSLLYLDLMSETDILACTDFVKQNGDIDIVVNNAAVVDHKPFRENTFETIKAMIRTNLEGTILLTHALMPFIQKKIINIGSRSGVFSFENLAPYSATKWGLRGFTKSLAIEYPSLLLCTVNPWPTATRLRDFKGIDPKNVAQVIADVCNEKIAVTSGDDINVEK